MQPHDTTLSPEQYLRYLQDVYAAAHGFKVQSGIATVSESDFEGMFTQFRADFEAMAPPGHDVRAYAWQQFKDGVVLQGPQADLVQTTLDTALKVLSSEDRRLLAAIPVGIVPHMLVNAHAIKVPGGGKVIVLNVGLLGALSAVNAFIFDKLSPVARPGGWQEFSHDVLDFVLMLRQRVLIDMSRPPMRPNHTAEVNFTAIKMARAQRVFILLHEIGHVVLGHLEEANLTSIHPSDDPDLGIKYYSKSQEQEFEADEWAVKRLRELSTIGDEHEYERCLAVLPLLFQTMHLIETILAPKLADTNTHPPARARLERIKEMTLRDSGGSELAAFDHAERLFTFIDLLLPTIHKTIDEVQVVEGEIGRLVNERFDAPRHPGRVGPCPQSGLASIAHPRANPERAARLNLEHIQKRRQWESLPWWKRLLTSKPEPPSGI